MPSRPSRIWHLPAMLALLCQVCACAPGPLSSNASQQLRVSLLREIRSQLSDPTTHPDPIQTTRQQSIDEFMRHFNLDESALRQRMAQLESMAGPKAYDYDLSAIPLGANLLGQPHEVIGVTLQEVVMLAARNNLQVQFAQLGPAVSQADIANALALFDWVFFSSVQAQSLKSPIQDRSSIGGTGPDVRSSGEFNATAGVRRNLTTGGQLTLQQELNYADTTESGIVLTPNPANRATASLELTQPLLRNFGSDVSLAEVRLAVNAERDAVQQLRSQLIETVTQTERTYWQLYQAYLDLLILQRLAERGEETYRYIKERQRIDANPAQIASAEARVRERYANVRRAQTVLRNRSDSLKLLINQQDLAISGEVLLVPLNSPPDAPVSWSLADAILTALERRPDIERAILSIDDTTIRRVVADNSRLPRLDLQLQLRLNALETDADDALGDQFNADFVDAVVGFLFEAPIGNRAAESDYRRRLLQQQQAVISFQNTVQQVIGEIKRTLDNVVTNYELIELEAVSRLAAAELLRVLDVQKQQRTGFTIETLETELNRQEGLANAERREIQALIDFNISIAELHQAMGSSLERNSIDFLAPDTPTDR
ncbi:MAG: TolC family protein [Phycisphaeraceae bacterium]|nr:TolC family protein [Phycisphaeraceae bacterium]